MDGFSFSKHHVKYHTDALKKNIDLLMLWKDLIIIYSSQ